MLAAHAGRFGGVRRVVSEREMRSGDGRAPAAQPRYGVRLGGVGPGGRDRLHYPDMVILTGTGHRVAFELELTTKEPERRVRISSTSVCRRPPHRRDRLPRGPPGGGSRHRALGAALWDCASW